MKEEGTKVRKTLSLTYPLLPPVPLFLCMLKSDPLPSYLPLRKAQMTGMRDIYPSLEDGGVGGGQSGQGGQLEGGQGGGGKRQ